MDIFGFDSASFLSFLLTFLRVSLIVFLLPFFGGESIPATVKAAVCIVLTMAIWPRLAVPANFFPAHPFGIFLLVASEVFLGMLMGLMVHFVFVGIQLGGQIIGNQMGFSMISMVDPSTGQQLVVTSFLAHTLALVIFLTLDGHIYILHALFSSFKLMPPGQLSVSAPAVSDMIRLSGGMFVLAVKVAGPIVACLFMVDLALALMARVAPQMNLLMIGFPIKIGVGFFFMSIMFSLISMRVFDLVRDIGPMFDNFMRAMGLRD